MKALVTWGGWDGHEPEAVAHLMRDILSAEGIAADVTDSLTPLDDRERLAAYALIVPVWTMAEMSRETAESVSWAVARGTGLAGAHGGMCDAFRGNPLWQMMTGGNWVAHPGGDGVRYTVRVPGGDPLTDGIGDFEVETEQYYLHVDPANRVLATTEFPTIPWHHVPNGRVRMPVLWTRHWGHGRVWYLSLGHKCAVLEAPAPRELLRRGLVWAAQGHAPAQGQPVAEYPGSHW